MCVYSKHGLSFLSACLGSLAFRLLVFFLFSVDNTIDSKERKVRLEYFIAFHTPDNHDAKDDLTSLNRIVCRLF